MVIFTVWLTLLTIFLYLASPLLGTIDAIASLAPLFSLIFYLLGTLVVAYFWVIKKHPFKKQAQKIAVNRRLFLKWLVVIAVGLLLTRTLTHFMSSQHYSDSGIILEKENAHDTFWHLALMASLDRSVPPENPIYAGEPLRGYHYFNDLLWVAVHQLTGTSFITLYLTIAPTLLSFYFVSTAYWLMKKASKSWWVIGAGTLLLTVGSGLAFAAPLLFPQAMVSQSMFWLDQPTHYAFNQQLLLALALMNVLLGELLFGNKNKSRWWVIATILVAMAGIKVYGVLLLVPAIVLSFGLSWVRGQGRSVMFGWLVGSVGAGLILLSAQGKTGWPFIFFPGYFFKTMFEANDRLASPVWELQRQVFAADHNYLRLSLHWFYAAIVFYLGNFGVKIVGLFLAAWLVIRRQWQTTSQLVLLLVIILGSWLAPALFIQKGVVWNTIQFMHFSQAPLVLLIVMGWEKWQLKKYLKIILLLLIVVFSLPTTFFSVDQYAQRDSFGVGFAAFKDGIHRLPENKHKTIIVDSQLGETSLVPAFVERPVYFADPAIAAILGLDKSEREQQMVDQSYCPKGTLFIHTDKDRKILIEYCEDVVTFASPSSSLIMTEPVVPANE